MRVRIEVDLRCNRISADDRLPFETGRDEIYFLIAAGGGAGSGAHVPAGELGYIGFRGDAPDSRSHVQLWEGELGTLPIKVGVLVMEQDNDSLGDSGRQGLEVLSGAVTKAPGTAGMIAAALGPVVNQILGIFSNKHDVIGGVSLEMVQRNGDVSVDYAAINALGAPGTVTLLDKPSPTEGRFKFGWAGADYDAVFRVY